MNAPRIAALASLLLSASCAMSSAGPAGSDTPPPNSIAPAAPLPPAPMKDALLRGPDTAEKPTTSAGRPAVVVELFSSEGCSSCPAADAVLRDLSSKQPVAGAEIIGLEMHVDYWDDLGWADPFSSAVYTSRQRAYSTAFGERSNYTPEMVVDGRAGFVGSERDTAEKAIARAAASPKATVTIARDGDTLAVAVTNVPVASPAAEVVLALAEDGLATDVKRGENAGSVLAHGPVVRSLTRLGGIAAGAQGRAFERSETVTLPAAWNRDHVRAVVLVQSIESRAILGAAWVSMK